MTCTTHGRVRHDRGDAALTGGSKDHWEAVYKNKSAESVSWFEETPALSLDLIGTACDEPCGVIDIGGGASRLVDALLDKDYAPVAVLDLSANALGVAKARLGDRAQHVEWIVADITSWQPAHRYDVWHDRAAFHFLTDAASQRAYANTVRAALKPGGIVIIGTFAPDGPERCSGLPVSRHDAASIAKVLGREFDQLREHRHAHKTPGGSIQQFQFSLFRHRA